MPWTDDVDVARLIVLSLVPLQIGFASLFLKLYRTGMKRYTASYFCGWVAAISLNCALPAQIYAINCLADHPDSVIERCSILVILLFAGLLAFSAKKRQDFDQAIKAAQK